MESVLQLRTNIFMPFLARTVSRGQKYLHRVARRAAMPPTKQPTSAPWYIVDRYRENGGAASRRRWHFVVFLAKDLSRVPILVTAAAAANKIASVVGGRAEREGRNRLPPSDNFFGCGSDFYTGGRNGTWEQAGRLPGRQQTTCFLLMLHTSTI